MKVMTFQDDIPSNTNDNFKDHPVLVFNFTSMQDFTESFHYSELVGEPLRPELNFNFPLEYASELSLVGERMSSIAVEKFDVGGKNM